MNSIRRGCPSLNQSNNGICQLLNGSRRAFSRSSVHHRGALPVFLPSSTTELSALLSDLRSKILLPKHLTRDQQNLVYKKKNIAKLEAEPIEITLGDVTLPLQHMDRIRGIPRTRKQIGQIISLSRTQEDWENVLRAMEGMANARLHVKSHMQEAVVRKLNMGGMHHLILKGLQRGTATGLHLRNIGVLIEVLRAARDKAATANWDAEELRKALSMAEQVMELLERKGSKPDAIDDHHAAKPIVIAVPLELAAELAYRHDGDVDKVKKYALRLMTALKQHDFMSSKLQSITEKVLQRTFKSRSEKIEARVILIRDLYSLIPVWNGLQTARTVLDEDMPMAEDAERVQHEIRALLQKGEEAVDALEIRNREKQIVTSDKDTYSAYLKDAIKRCEDDGE